ncbi:ABC transporter permease subunit [Planctomycetota bacterium]|nr:ABC transporter permease subunit [Planctomycetota bacterium]
MRGSLLRAVLAIARKELLEILRDRRSLFVLILLPVLLYPLMFVGTGLATTAQVRKLKTKRYRVWVQQLDTAPQRLVHHLRVPTTGSPPVSALQAGGGNGLSGGTSLAQIRLEVTAPPSGADFDEALSEGQVEAIVTGIPGLEAGIAADEAPALEVHFNAGVDASTFAQLRVLTGIEAWKDELTKARLAQNDLPEAVLEPVRVVPVNRGAAWVIFARVLSTLLIVLSLTGAFYPALDLGVGEKERGTLETLLLAPVPRVAVALGKFVAVFSVSLVSAILQLLSLGVTFSSMLLLAPAGKLGDLSLELSAGVLGIVLLVLIPLVALFSALSLAVATFAASYKEGQAYLTPLMLVGMAPAMMAALPGVELTPTLCLVPVAGAALLVKELLAQTAWSGQVVLVVGSTAVYAALAIRWVASLYDREEVLWRPAAAGSASFNLERAVGRADASGRPSLVQSLTLGVLVVLLATLVGGPLIDYDAWVGMGATEVLLVALPAVAWVRMLKADPRRTFRFEPARPAAYLAACLLGLGAAVLGLDLSVLQAAHTAPLSPGEAARLEAMALSLLSQAPGALVALLVVRAAAQELVFRGVVLTGLRSQAGRVVGVLAASLLFAVAGPDPRLIASDLFLGILLAGLVLRSGSLMPAVLAHSLYAVAGLASRGPLAVAEVGLLAEGAPTWTLRGPALAALVLGILLIPRASATEANEGPPGG